MATSEQPQATDIGKSLSAAEKLHGKYANIPVVDSQFLIRVSKVGLLTAMPPSLA